MSNVVRYNKVTVYRSQGHLSVDVLNIYGADGWTLCNVEEYKDRFVYVFYRNI